MGERLGLVAQLIGGATVAVGLLISIAKLWAYLNKGNGRRWDLASFKALLEAKDKENAKLREERDFERERKEYYRTEAHRLGNHVFEIAEQLHDCLGDLEGERRKPDETGKKEA